jgi:hypothetical protein
MAELVMLHGPRIRKRGVGLHVEDEELRGSKARTKEKMVTLGEAILVSDRSGD